VEFDGIHTVPFTSPWNSAMKFLGTTRRPSFFDMCFARKKPPGERVWRFFRYFRRSFPPGMAVYRAISGLSGLLPIGFFPLPASPPASGSDDGNTPNSYFAGSAYTVTK
jgi:hypothetical protein